MGVNSPQELLAELELDGDKFVALLGKLIGEAKSLQNNPPELIPTEDLAVKHVLDVLRPFGREEGGPLVIKHVTYVEGRGNLIVEYPGTASDGQVVSFVGSHMDVVTANPDDWVSLSHRFFILLASPLYFSHFELLKLPFARHSFSLQTPVFV